MPCNSESGVVIEPTIEGKTREQWLAEIERDNTVPYRLPGDRVDEMFDQIEDIDQSQD
ncbi:hypothetical protein GW755_00910 [bacterium]|nr:hypothetical protein [bacterium]